MKIKSWELEKTLCEGLHPVYIISGNEPFQKEEACQNIRKKAQLAGFTEQITYHADHQFDWEVFKKATSTLSLLSVKQVIELRFLSDAKFNGAAELSLKFYASKLPLDIILIIVSNKIITAIERSNWFKQLEQVGIWIQVWPIEGHKLIQWLSDRIKRIGLKPSQEALTLLAEKCEGNMLAGSQEIEKLSLLASEKKITLEHVHILVADSAHYDGFMLCDAIISGNTRRAIQIYRGLCATGIELSKLLWLIVRELRILNQLTKLIGCNITLDAAITQIASDQLLPLFALKRRRHEYLGCINRSSIEDINYLINQALVLDYLLKTENESIISEQFLTIIIIMSGVSEAKKLI